MLPGCLAHAGMKPWRYQRYEGGVAPMNGKWPRLRDLHINTIFSLTLLLQTSCICIQIRYIVLYSETQET